VLLGLDGRVLGRASASYATSRPEPGAAEQDPADWLTVVKAVIRQLADTAGPSAWLGIGLSAMLPTLVLADEAGEPVGPAITWEDGRAESYGTELRGDEVYRRTGQWVDGRYLIPMALRLAATEPGRIKAASHLLGAKDYLYRVLTGESLTDPSTAAGVGCYDLVTGNWIPELIPAGLPRLPEIGPAETSRPLLPGAASALGLVAGTPVVLGGADSVLGALGLGLTRPGQVAYIAGTSNVILALSDTPVIDPLHRHLVTPMAGVSGWGLEMDLLATGSAHDWLAGLLTGGDHEALAVLAAEVNPADAPIFLPYLLPGEQGARWDPKLTGVVAGLHLAHGPGHLARGLLSGIIAESRHCLTLLETAAGPGEIFLAGGGASALAADLADATGRTVVPPDPARTDSSAIGAAMIAADRSLPTSHGPERRVVTPDGTRATHWAQLADQHEATLAALKRKDSP
jgi:xylulokinase